MTMLFLSYGCCFQALGQNSTWRELVRRDFVADDRQMKHFAAELTESADAEATSSSGATAASPSPLALPAPLSLPSAAYRARRESEWKRLYM